MKQTILSGTLLDDETELSLDDFCEVCSSSSEFIIELVEEGVLEPTGYKPAQWRFTAASLHRARTAARLQRDLDVNIAGVALALELMDEIENLRTQLRRYGMIESD